MMGLQRVISGRKFALVNTVLLIKMALFLIPLVLSLISSEVRGYAAHALRLGCIVPGSCYTVVDDVSFLFSLRGDPFFLPPSSLL